MSNSKVVIYTDGACHGNPGPGGWGAVIIKGEDIIELSSGDPNTTNNRMEMTAIFESLNALEPSSQVTLYSDSQYVVNTMTQGWNRGANVDLWRKIDDAVSRHQVSFQWVKGHAGNEHNERADRLAVAESEKFIYAEDNAFQPDVTVYIGGFGSSDTVKAAWVALLETNEQENLLHGQAKKASAYQMELTAAVNALESIMSPMRVMIYTSGDIIANGMKADWIAKWKANNWRKSDGKTVAHKALWQQLDAANQRHETRWRKSDERTARLREIAERIRE